MIIPTDLLDNKFERRSEVGQAIMFYGKSLGVLARKSAQRKD